MSAVRQHAREPNGLSTSWPDRDPAALARREPVFRPSTTTLKARKAADGRDKRGRDDGGFSQGLYNPALAKASCGVGFIADIKGKASHGLIEDALAIL